MKIIEEKQKQKHRAPIEKKKKKMEQSNNKLNDTRIASLGTQIYRVELVDCRPDGHTLPPP